MTQAIHCSFCGISQHEVRVMLTAPVPANAAICSYCLISACDQVVDHARTAKPLGQQIVFADAVTVAGLPDNLSNILARATREMTMAQERFPGPNYTLLKVAEETGELVKAAVHYRELRGVRWADVEDEAMEADAAKMPRQKGGWGRSHRISDDGRGRIGAATAARNSARTDEVRDDILRLHAEGLCGTEIGRRLGRDPKAVRRLIRSVEAAQ